METARILLVSSNLELQELMRNLLSHRLPNVTQFTAVNRELALTINAELHPQVVLVDFSVLRARNLAFLTDVRSNNTGTTIYVLSAYESQEYANAMYTKGGDGYLCVGSNDFIPEFYKKLVDVLDDNHAKLSFRG